MRVNIKHSVLLGCFLLFSLAFYGQVSQHPPAPQMNSTLADDGPQLCDDVEDPNDPNPPPPVGLCVPIDEYILLLVLAGLGFGTYKTYKLQKRINPNP